MIPHTMVPHGAIAGYEFVLNGFSEERVKKAMKCGIEELCSHNHIIKITAGNYEGKLGKIRFDLKNILSQ
jgi:formylmethanofuran--tetrahydromethanopterin N-formyltransferase